MNIDQLIRPRIKSIKAYSSARDEFSGEKGNLTFLDANENPFDNGINRYPDPQQLQVKQVISRLKNIPVPQIFLGNGSDEILDLLMRMFCEPNQDNIIILPPTYGMYEVLANINAVEVKTVNLSTSFQPQVEEILSTANERSKLLFICTPNNPTGNNIETEAIEQLLGQFNGIVVIDEAYIDFSEGPSWSQRLSEFPNLVVTQTLSKAYGMAGIRLGICYASRKILSTMNKIKPPYNINQLTQEKALEQLGQQLQFQQQLETLKEQRKWLTGRLRDVPWVEHVFTSDANFILVRVDDANKRYDQLVQQGIVVRNRTSQPLCDNTLRITVGTPEENKKMINLFNSL